MKAGHLSMTPDEKKREEQSGAGQSTGKASSPSSRPDESNVKRKGSAQEISIGMPVIPDEFRKLKKRAQETDEAASDENPEQADDSQEKTDDN
jgi:hypothetical protein